MQNTATDRGRTERQIHNLERALHRAGLIQWNDTENYKRYGRRDHRGYIEYAYGVDLTPLGLMYDRLVELNEQHMAYMATFNEIKHKVSGLRRRIISKINFANELAIDIEEAVNELAIVPRIAANMPISTLTDILNKVRKINFALDDLLNAAPKPEVLAPSQEPDKSGSCLKKNFRHLQPTASPQFIYINCNQQVDDDKKEVGDIFSSGVGHITYEMVMSAASDEFIECIQPSAKTDKFSDFVSAAAHMCHRMGIGRFAWIKACLTMGDTAAAVAVLIIDRNRQHPIIPVVNPGGVLRGMTAKDKTGDLNLHRTLYGILSRGKAGGKA